MTYDDLIRELFPRLSGGIRWGLERTTRLLDSVGDPHRQFRTIHIGGTNGKGSVAALMASTLSESGLRTGLYTSPHLCTFRERIQIDGRPIGVEPLLAAAERLWPAVEAQRPSFFEATTALAFLALAEAGVRVAAVEVGLGGRLDATNVIEPDVVVLTNVALDHVQLLGDTVQAVAVEKAGIIKPGVPVVTAESDAVPLGVFEAAALAAGARLDVIAAADILAAETGLAGTSILFAAGGAGAEALWAPLPGAHQARNMAVAARALAALPPDLRPVADAVRGGFAAVRWPGRLQVERVHGRTWLFDVAHNVAGAESLAAALHALEPPGPVAALIGVLGDKDWRGMLGPLFAGVDAAVLTRPPTAPAERAWDPAAVVAEVPAAHAEAVIPFEAALEKAWRLAGPAGTVLVTGSFHTVGDAMIALGCAPFGADAGLPVPAFAA